MEQVRSSLLHHRLPGKDRLRILIQFLLMILASSVAGGIFPFLLNADTLSKIAVQADLHFAASFWGTIDIKETFWLLLRYSAVDLCCVAILSIAAFSALYCTVTDLILCFEGFRFGFFAVILYHIVSESVLLHSVGWIHFAVFVALKAVTLLFFLMICTRVTDFIYLARRYTADGRLRLGWKRMTAASVGFVILGCILFVLNAIYCWLICIV